MSNLINNITNIDSDWINDFYELESKIIKFYKSKVNTVNVHFCYVNQYNEMQYTEVKPIELNENSIIEKNNLLSFILKHSSKKYVLGKYKLKHILQYNFTINPEDIHTLFNKVPLESEYSTIYNNIQDIKFFDTIETLKNINSLYLFFKNETHKGLYSKKIYRIKKKRFTRRILDKKCI